MPRLLRSSCCLDGIERRSRAWRTNKRSAVNVKQLQKFCQNLPGTNERLLPDPYNILVYSMDKINFAYFKTSEPERWRFSIKVTPDRFVELTDVPGVKPARYRGRYHWVTIVDVANFPAGYLKELVTWSHRYAMDGLSIVRRRALMGESLMPTGGSEAHRLR